MAKPKVSVELTEKELRILGNLDLRMHPNLQDKLSDASKRLKPIKTAYNNARKAKRKQNKDFDKETAKSLYEKIKPVGSYRDVDGNWWQWEMDVTRNGRWRNHSRAFGGIILDENFEHFIYNDLRRLKNGE